jgi:hypothetical protein
MSFYKDLLQDAWRELLALDEPDEDEEKKERKEKQTLNNAVGQALTTANPLAIGTVGESGQAFIMNKVAFAIWKAQEDRNISYKKWKQETGGFVFDQDVDWGLLALGFEPTVEATQNLINLTDLVADDELILEDDFGNLKVLDNDKDLENVMWAKAIIEALSQAGINESDVFNALRKVHDEEIRTRRKDAETLED